MRLMKAAEYHWPAKYAKINATAAKKSTDTDFSFKALIVAMITGIRAIIETV
jgi:hypothetical protein